MFQDFVTVFNLAYCCHNSHFMAETDCRNPFQDSPPWSILSSSTPTLIVYTFCSTVTYLVLTIATCTKSITGIFCTRKPKIYQECRPFFTCSKILRKHGHEQGNGMDKVNSIRVFLREICHIFSKYQL